MIISLIITLINSVLASSLRKLTNYEKHSNLTDLNRSLILKISVSQFINTCLLVVSIHMILVSPNRYIWAKGKL